jgi:putative N6-adenine-specific DNA methylase
MKFVAKTLFGLEKILASELEELGARDVQPANRAVLFSGDKLLLYRINYCSRIALSILVNIADFRIRSKDDLYNRTSGIDWTQFMENEQTFSVVPVVNSEMFAHSGYPGLVVKDAIADFFRRKTGKRPSVDPKEPDVVINLHISNDNVNISLDSTVVPLFKRGYRVEQGAAPLNEVLAAGILRLTGWNGESSLLDPMCGSGTILIEAAMVASNIAPGKFREFFGFFRWKDFDKDLYDRVRSDMDKMVCRSDIKIEGSDISEHAVDQARANIANAGLSNNITVGISDFSDLKSSGPGGYIFINPPYGQRLKHEEIEKLYGMIGSTLKHRFAGNRACIITSGKEYLNNIGLKPASKHVLFNGSIECILAEYKLYEGSAKHAETLKSP